MNYVYTPNPTAAKPVVLVDRYIGKPADNGAYIDGSQFAHEVLSLKDSGKSDIEVWINSKGGRISDGFSMHTALLNSGINATTINMGVVDSTAGWVFLAGTRRLWAPHALGLIHEVTNASGEVNEEASASIATIISSRTNLSVTDARSLMKENRIINAQEALAMGFADALFSQQVKMGEMLNATNANNTDTVYDYGKKFAETLIKSGKMNINELLGLDNAADADSQYKAIQALVEARNAVTTKITELENANTTLRTERATALVDSHVGTRIEDKPEVKAKWVGLATTDYEGTKALIESINLNKQAPKAPAPGTTETAATANSEVITSVGQYMTRNIAGKRN